MNQLLEDDEQAIAHALVVLQARLRKRDVLASPEEVKDYLRLQAQGLDHEVFAVMYLDPQSQLVGYERLFRGTLMHTSIYPREIVKHALLVNAASVILHHNHPYGTCHPSPADKAVTLKLMEALALVDIKVLDHIITNDEGAVSMAELAMFHEYEAKQ